MIKGCSFICVRKLLKLFLLTSPSPCKMARSNEHLKITGNFLHGKKLTGGLVYLSKSDQGGGAI